MIANSFLVILTACVSFGLSFIVIYLSGLYKAGQSIREEGPKQHMKKAGTPTFGGAAFMSAFFLSAFIFIDLNASSIALLLAVLAFSLIGFADDHMKVVSGRNEGLSPANKMGLQIIVSIIFGAALLFQFHDVTVSGILKAMHFDLPWLYLPLVAFIMVGASNAANLTDGLDGLLCGTSIIAFCSLAVLAYRSAEYDIFGLCLIIIGALAGFLLLNMNPAKIFMGDVGSLGLGALMAGVAVILHKELFLAVIGGVFVVETLSVIMQVAFFKLFKRRVFKMSPLHHHFELSGMKEKNVVYMFWIAAAIFGILGVII